MDEEIEDMVGDVKYTDSQKSITTSSNMYSPDFTDYSSRGSDKHNSSGRETYIIEYDSEDSDPNLLHDCNIHKTDCKTTNNTELDIPIKLASTRVPGHMLFAQETYTQTSKTIIELAETEGVIKRNIDSHTLETQTSFFSITENRTVEYRIEVSSAHECLAKDIIDPLERKVAYFQIETANVDPLNDESTKYPVSDTENSECSSIIRIIDKESNGTLSEGKNDQFIITSDCDSIPASDIEEDSLMTETSDEMKDLRDKISESQAARIPDRFDEEIRRFGTLTPLTEESNMKKDSSNDNIVEINMDDVLFTNNSGMKVKLLRDNSSDRGFKLPTIQNHSCPTSPHLSSLFGKQNLSKAGTLPSLYEKQNWQDRWEISTKALASGESTMIKGRIPAEMESPRKSVNLPPIHAALTPALKHIARATSPPAEPANQPSSQPITIKEKIKELKNKQRNVESRSVSPGSLAGEENRLSDIADRGCETLCSELLRRLRAGIWYEIVDTLDELPKLLDRFWGVISEQRIADLVRQVSTHVESPRLQVARTACATLSAILKNTNYTKKPDFYEAITILLAKTGSYSSAVRRSANVALDDIVCGVELTHAVTALCLHGVSHKNALVRCASARLLVVCCALASGGRELLRARPPTAAAARRHALRALAALLDDKSSDARKYAERLYSMLRPLSNFEAYYLTDVEVELASRQMKKYDQMLLCGPAKER